MAIFRRVTGAATTMLAAGALLAAPAAVSAGASAASAGSCRYSQFTVVWPVAGIYVKDGGGYRRADFFVNQHLGDHVSGPTGGSDGTWTAIYLPADGIGYMKDPALRFDYCF